MASATITFHCRFEDNEVQKISVGTFNSANLPSDLADKAEGFSDSTSEYYYEDFDNFKTALVSSTGSQFKNFAQIDVTTTERYYYTLPD